MLANKKLTNRRKSKARLQVHRNLYKKQGGKKKLIYKKNRRTLVINVPYIDHDDDEEVSSPTSSEDENTSIESDNSYYRIFPEYYRLQDFNNQDVDPGFEDGINHLYPDVAHILGLNYERMLPFLEDESSDGEDSGHYAHFNEDGRPLNDINDFELEGGVPPGYDFQNSDSEDSLEVDCDLIEYGFGVEDSGSADDEEDDRACAKCIECIGIESDNLNIGFISAKKQDKTMTEVLPWTFIPSLIASITYGLCEERFNFDMYDMQWVHSNKRGSGEECDELSFQLTLTSSADSTVSFWAIRISHSFWRNFEHHKGHETQGFPAVPAFPQNDRHIQPSQYGWTIWNAVFAHDTAVPINYTHQWIVSRRNRTGLWNNQFLRDESHIQYQCFKHEGIVVCLKRSHFADDVILSVSEYSFCVWKEQSRIHKERKKNMPWLQSWFSEEAHGTHLQSRILPLCWRRIYNKKYWYRNGEWSPLRASQFYLLVSTGEVEIYDTKFNEEVPVMVAYVGINTINHVLPYACLATEDEIAFVEDELFYIWKVPYPLKNKSFHQLKYLQKFASHEAWRRGCYDAWCERFYQENDEYVQLRICEINRALRERRLSRLYRDIRYEQSHIYDYLYVEEITEDTAIAQFMDIKSVETKYVAPDRLRYWGMKYEFIDFYEAEKSREMMRIKKRLGLGKFAGLEVLKCDTPFSDYLNHVHVKKLTRRFPKQIHESKMPYAGPPLNRVLKYWSLLELYRRRPRFDTTPKEMQERKFSFDLFDFYDD